jgi:hypothetical protein
MKSENFSDHFFFSIEDEKMFTLRNKNKKEREIIFFAKRINLFQFKYLSFESYLEEVI